MSKPFFYISILLLLKCYLFSFEYIIVVDFTLERMPPSFRPTIQCYVDRRLARRIRTVAAAAAAESVLKYVPLTLSDLLPCVPHSTFVDD